MYMKRTDRPQQCASRTHSLEHNAKYKMLVFKVIRWSATKHIYAWVIFFSGRCNAVRTLCNSQFGKISNALQMMSHRSQSAVVTSRSPFLMFVIAIVMVVMMMIDVYTRPSILSRIERSIVAWQI